MKLLTLLDALCSGSGGPKVKAKRGRVRLARGKGQEGQGKGKLGDGAMVGHVSQFKSEACSKTSAVPCNMYQATLRT